MSYDLSKKSFQLISIFGSIAFESQQQNNKLTVAITTTFRLSILSDGYMQIIQSDDKSK
jgi:hypothetical protein